MTDLLKMDALTNPGTSVVALSLTAKTSLTGGRTLVTLAIDAFAPEHRMFDECEDESGEPCGDYAFAWLTPDQADQLAHALQTAVDEIRASQ